MREDNEIAIEIVMDNIAKLMDEYAFTKDEDESKKLKEKIDFLEELKEDLYLNKEIVIKSVLERHKKGNL